VSMVDGDAEFKLVQTDKWLELRHRGEAIHVDFVGGAVGHRRLYGGGRGQPMARAVGLSGGKSPSVLDVTAGLGRDAFVLASLGCQVTLVERSPLIAALLEDGLERAAKDPAISEIIGRMRLYCADGLEYMKAIDEKGRPDVIYLDPMFPPRKKSAQVKKEMRLLQTLLVDEGDGSELLPVALQSASERVVVKRPGYADWLGGLEPTMAITSKKHRFDVYVVKSLNRRHEFSELSG
jgi:16S rRNA (guanine1516-N2)-methyltransferase